MPHVEVTTSAGRIWRGRHLDDDDLTAAHRAVQDAWVERAPALKMELEGGDVVFLNTRHVVSVRFCHSDGDDVRSP
jgi:hypothetical protein